MEKYMDMPNRKYPKRMGNTLNLFIMRNGNPLVTIGPHLGFSMGLIIFSLFVAAATLLMNYQLGMTWFFFSFAAGFPFGFWFLKAVFMYPGYADLTVTQRDIDYVIWENYTWWRRCKVVKRTNTVHCHECGVCVEDLDHHCPWFSKCITQRNLKYFWGALGGAAFFGAYFWISAVTLMLKFRNVHHPDSE